MTIARNTMWLMVAQAVGLLGPLIMVPFLARALGPAGWAPVLAAQALAAWLILILEYASDLSGTRDVARTRQGDGARARLADLFRGVQSAKLLLVPLAMLILALASALVPVLRGQGQLLGWTIAYALCRGFNPFWYFQGVERVRFAAAVDGAMRTCAAVVVIIAVRAPGDGWMVLAVQAGFAFLELVTLTWVVARETPLLLPSVAAGSRALRATWPVFGIRAVGGVYTQASTLLLGVTAAPAVVAAYGGSDRIVRAAISMLQPVTQAVLPRVSYLHAGDPRAALGFVDRALVIVGSLGALMGTVLFVGAPTIVHLLLGPAYDAAVPALRALAFLPPIIAASTVFGVYWALPFGRERFFLAAIVVAAAVNLALVSLLAPRGGVLGICMAVIASEVVVLVLLASEFVRRRP